jgi:hypothetical protein
MSGLSAPAAEPDPEPEPSSGEQEMMTVCLQCGIEVTHHQRQPIMMHNKDSKRHTFIHACK